MCKSLGLVAVGFVASVASAFFYLALAVALKRLGVPPASWFGSDYIDPRCSAVAGGSALFSLAVFSFGAGAFANKHLGPVGPAGAFWLCNPISTSAALILARQVMMNLVPYEFIQPLLYLIVVGWFVGWHLSLIGSRSQKPFRGTLVAALYTVGFSILGLVHSYPRYVH
jgi:hypothetical protein